MQQDSWTKMTKNKTWLLLKSIWDFFFQLYILISIFPFHLEVSCFEAEDPHLSPIYAAPFLAVWP